MLAVCVSGNLLTKKLLKCKLYCNLQLYDRGYGKDPAGIAMEAISSARDYHIDVVLVDTAGRMQDNEPLMRALSKVCSEI